METLTNFCMIFTKWQQQINKLKSPKTARDLQNPILFLFTVMAGICEIMFLKAMITIHK